MNKTDEQESRNGGIFSKELFQLAYKLALKSLNSGHSEPVIRLLDISTRVIFLFRGIHLSDMK